MPNDVIDRAVKKATEPSQNMIHIVYEAYGPGGVGIVVSTLTDNKNRTAQEVKHILSKHGATLGGIGSVVWAFDNKHTAEGVVWEPKSTVGVSDNDLKILESIVDELEENDDVQDVYTNAE